jgi:peptide/nickel transport system substrate-binding protein
VIQVFRRYALICALFGLLGGAWWAADAITATIGETAAQIDGARVSAVAAPVGTVQHAPPAPTPEPVRGGKVVIGGLGRLDTLNPLRAESQAARQLLPLLYDSLLHADPTSGQPTPGLAAHWQAAPDSRVITFTLRSDARWSDGNPVTADDVRFSLLTALDPAQDSLYGARLRYVQDVSAPDASTVVVQLSAPDCPALAYVGDIPIIPAAWANLMAADGAIAATTPLTAAIPGSGPLALDPASSPDEVRMVRNVHAQPPTYLDSIVYRVFDSAAHLHAALSDGEVDVAWFPSAGEAGAAADLVRFTYPTGPYLAVAFNNDHPLLSDARVRNALSLALDRPAILKRLTDDQGVLLAGSLPPFHWAADPQTTPPPYDPVRARALLAEAGWRDSDGDGWLDRQGERLRLPVRTHGGNPLRETAAMLTVGYYRTLGIDAAVEIVSWATLVGDLFTHHFGVVVFGWPLDAEPERALWLSTENAIGSGLNVVSFADAEVDRLLTEAAGLPGCTTAGRARLYRRVQAHLADARPYDFLLAPPAALVTRADLVGPAPGPYAVPYWNAATWHLRTR